MISQNIDISSWKSLYIWCDMQIVNFVTETNCNDPLCYVQYRGFVGVSRSCRLAEKCTALLSGAWWLWCWSDLLLICDLQNGRSMALLQTFSHILNAFQLTMPILSWCTYREFLCPTIAQYILTLSVCYSNATRSGVSTSSGTLLLCKLMLQKCIFQWPRGLRRRSAAFRLLGLWVRIPAEAWMSVTSECYVLSGSGLCVGLITRPEESFRMGCVWVWSWITVTVNKEPID